MAIGNELNITHDLYEICHSRALDRIRLIQETKDAPGSPESLGEIFLLYSKSLPLDVACRVWDVYCRDGEELLFRTGLGILKFYESILIKMDFIHAAQFLTKLPEDICADQLFKHIDTIHMTIDKRKFPAVLAYYKDTRGESNS
nr:hypothetical protein BaRGS_015458 [Batillaria attramentaria]